MELYEKIEFVSTLLSLEPEDLQKAFPENSEEILMRFIKAENKLDRFFHSLKDSEQLKLIEFVEHKAKKFTPEDQEKINRKYFI